MGNTSDTILHKAEYLIEIARYQEALPHLTQVLAQNPQDYQALCLSAQCFYELKDFAESCRCAEKAILSEPENEWGHRLRSLSLSELGNKKEAVKSAEKAVSLAPLELAALQTLSFAYLENNKVRKATEIAEKMLEYHPDSDNTFFVLGNVCLDGGNFHQAELYYREALRLNPLNANARNNLGVAILRQDNRPTPSILQDDFDEDAAVHFREAAKLDPTNKFAQDNLRRQYFYYPYLFTSISLIPFLILSFFVVPIGAIITLFLSLWSLAKLIWKIWRKRKNTSPEIKNFLSSAKPFSINDYFNEFKGIAGSVFQKTWQPHLLAVASVFVSFLGLIGKQSGMLRFVAILMIIGSGVWLTRKLNHG